VNHRDFTDVGPKRSHSSASTVYANPILLVDPDVELGSGLRRQLTRHGFCADLAITGGAARACVGHKCYHAIVVVADPSNSQVLFGLRQLREAAPQTWMVVVASKFAATASRTVLELGADSCLVKPFRFSDLLFRLESFAHHKRAA
jgi:two-component system, OmpR family, copper resistance phosphate regulon response regulator CusR